MDWPQINWNAISAIATAAMAISTFCLIRQSARHHRALLAQQSSEHRDRLKPICFLAPFDGVDAHYRRHDLVTIIDPDVNNRAYKIVILHCSLKNVGLGPALNLHLTFRSDNGDTTEPSELNPLGAGEMSGSPQTPLAVPIKDDKRSLFDVSWQIWLEYEDVFGRKFRSVHRSMTYHTDPATYKWTGKGQAKLRPISWVSFEEK